MGRDIITPEQAQAMLVAYDLKMGIKHPDDGLRPDPDAVDRESKLQNAITKHCDEHGFPVQCFRQSIKARGFLRPGFPD